MQEEITQRKNQSLGRGLSALLGETLQDETITTVNGDSLHIDISLIRPGKYQPRQTFNEENLESLIASVREKGIIQPLVIRPLGAGREGPYEIIAGERRWRAAKTLNFNTVPAIIRLCSDEETLELALIENIQRDDLSPIEEAEGFQRLINEFSYTQDKLATSVGKSRSHIANTLRLNNLPIHVKHLIKEGKITAGHARALMTSENMDGLVERIVNEKLNVREAEKLAKKNKLEIAPNEFDLQAKHLEQEIAQILGMTVSLKIAKSGGSVVISFSSYEEIDDLIDKLRLLK